MKKLLWFVHRTMAIAQLTHLHLTIPSSGTTTGPVPPECFPVVPLSRESAVSHRVSFAREIDVIESSPLLFSPGEELESFTAQWIRGPSNGVIYSNIQVARPTYALFPSDDTFDVSDGISTPRYPYLPAPPGFTPIAKLGDIPWPAGPTSLHDASSLVASDYSDGDKGLLA